MAYNIKSKIVVHYFSVLVLLGKNKNLSATACLAISPH